MPTVSMSNSFAMDARPPRENPGPSSLPLLPYKVGDVAAAGRRPCRCGRGLPVLEKVEGRESDYVTTESGELISGISLTENFALYVPGVAQMQIVQESITQFR